MQYRNDNTAFWPSKVITHCFFLVDNLTLLARLGFVTTSFLQSYFFSFPDIGIYRLTNVTASTQELLSEKNVKVNISVVISTMNQRRVVV